ncbi:DUF1642 domain-containing protein [Streptococcus parasanguinis]|uniref:DUF1642 domain-containing protein n=1 Tax=Streptococcus parasanguinis TaxID=1318 RepID=UPI00066E8C4F|nr:DUF1642 domain-containing protein [Streptococcus parasanguinis]
MNKQELIEKYVYMKRNLETWVCIPDILKDLKQLDEPQKVKIPKFVAECIEYAQASDWDLEDVFQSIANELDTSEISVWFYSKSENMDTLASAWLYGYEIEPEKRYTVKMKGMNLECEYLYFGECSQTWKFKEENAFGEFRACHTEKELRKDGFGWVFNCPGIEVKEVKE